MKDRDEKTKREQQILNQYESVLYDAELEEEEDSFIENTTPEEIEVSHDRRGISVQWLNDRLSQIKEYIEKVHNKEMLFDSRVMKDVIKSVKDFLEEVDNRVVGEL